MIKFGTGGWRAVIGDDFNRENIRRVAGGLLRLMDAHGTADKPIVIGYDRRFLSDIAAKWLAEVLAGGGVRVIMMKRSAPTPLIMHAVMKMGLHYGLEVTASHNPPEYNGVKLIVDEGRDAPVEITEELENCINSLPDEDLSEGVHNDVSFEAACESGLVDFRRDLFNSYIDDIIDVLDMKAIRERGLRILFNPMHGSGTFPFMAIFYTARCTIDIVNFNKDAYFGGQMPAPDEKTLYDFASQVKEGGYDLGIAFDGDGDRLGIIDSDGSYIDANKILVLLYNYLHEYKGWRGPVVRNMSTTHMLDAVAASFGEKCYEVPVGFKYVSSKIDEVDAVLGGESSGGLTVRGHIHGKDSIYAAAIFTEMVACTGKSPSEMLRELTDRYGRYEMVECNLRFTPERRDELMDTLFLERRLPEFDDALIDRVNYVDGCKVYFTDGSFVVCRFSGTEPLLRIFAEAQRPERARSYIAAFRAMLDL